MTYRELKQENAAFKTWYIPRICKAGTYRMHATELSSGLRFAVERDNKLIEIWKKEGKKYERVL